MKVISRHRRTAGTIAAAAAMLACASPTAAATLRFAETIMTNLANPRGLTVGADGAVYVAESGSGGSGPTIISGDGFTVLNYGTTGGVSRYLGGVQSRILNDLPSLAPSGGSQAHGPQDLAFGADGRLYVAMGLGGDPRQLDDPAFAGLPGVDLVGTVAVSDGTSLQVFADIPQFEIDNNPDGGNIDTNVYGIVPQSGGGFLVTDAGGNAVLAVDASGNVSTVAVLPNLPNTSPVTPPPVYQAVPTGAIAGPLGEFIFGQLTGFPFIPGAANIFSVSGGALDSLATGFTNVIDVGLGADGTIYALELDSDSLVFGPGTTGSIFSIASDGSRTLVASGLENPTGMVVGPKGNFYVSVNGFSPDGGSVIRLAPVPLPTTLPALAGALGLLAWRARRPAKA